MLSPVLTTMLAGFVTLLHPDGGQDQAGVSLGEARRDAPAARLAEEVRRYGWLVFSARSERGDWDLFVCRPDGSDRRNLTRTPESNEAAAQFSRDGRRFLFRRLPVGEPIDGNHYGAQGELMLAGSDGSTPTVLGQGGEYPWASWSPDGKQVACLSVKGISIVDVATRQVVRKLPRQGLFQQLTWSPDGRWLSGVSNSFGASWSVALIEIATGKAHAVSGADCCTPDWFPDSRRLVFSNRPAGQSENHGNGWTQLWMADADGRNRRLVYGEDGRHIYGGQVSPDGKYVVFTENVQEIGDPRHAGAPMGLLRLADAPIIGGESRELRKAAVQNNFFIETVARLPGPIRNLARELPGEHGSGPRAMMFGLPPLRLVADFRASAMGIKPKSPGSVATVSFYLTVLCRMLYNLANPGNHWRILRKTVQGG